MSSVPTDGLADESYEHLRYVPKPDDPRVAGLGHLTARTFAEARLAIPVLAAVAESWREAYQAPFVGITSDGQVRPDAYDLTPARPEEAAPLDAVRQAMGVLRASVDDTGWEQLTYPIDSVQWRAWSNPEVLVFDNGLRLEEVSVVVRDAVHGVLEASLSPVGYRTITHLMKLNGYLGSLVGLPAIMNTASYQFAVFGDPFGESPWGWQLYGHHVCLNVVFAGGRMTMGPVFLGAEPDVLTDGPQAGVRVLEARERLGLELLRSLEPQQLATARQYDHVEGPDLPAQRVHPTEGRHLCGAFTDNRVVPTEGLPGRDLTESQRSLLLALCDEYSMLLPDGPRAARLREIASCLDETYVTWIGGIDQDDVFYYRVQSPVLIAEFDHHAGMWLTNEHPARFHIHTIMRLPNGNDYGTLWWGR